MYFISFSPSFLTFTKILSSTSIKTSWPAHMATSSKGRRTGAYLYCPNDSEETRLSKCGSRRRRSGVFWNITTLWFINILLNFFATLVLIDYLLSKQSILTEYTMLIKHVWCDFSGYTYFNIIWFWM